MPKTLKKLKIVTSMEPKLISYMKCSAQRQRDRLKANYWIIFELEWYFEKMKNLIFNRN